MNTLCTQGNDTRASEGALLALKLTNTYNDLKHEYKPFLFVINLTEKEITLLRGMTRDFFMGALGNQDLPDFLEAWDKGGLLFFSCVSCARDLEKDGNRDFWLAYYQWLGIYDVEGGGYSQSTVNQWIKSFWEEKGIQYYTSRIGNTQFVLTFLMHSIVSNRPLSKELAVKFLVKVIKSSGTMYHDSEEQQDLFGDELLKYSQPIIDEIDYHEQNATYLQLPRETALAFYYSGNQVEDYLLPIYDYLEKHLIDKINNWTTAYSCQVEDIPKFILPEVEKVIEDTTVDEIIRIRSIKSYRYGRATITLDTSRGKLNFIIPPQSFNDLDKNAQIDFRITCSDGQLYYQQKDMKFDSVKTMIITKELTISCTKIDDKFNYQFSHKGNVKASGSISCSCLFDLEGELIPLPCKYAQPVYCIAKPDSIIADDLHEIQSDFIPGYSLWDFYFSEDSPIIIDNILYGIDPDISSVKFGYTLSRGPYQQVSFLDGKDEYQVIGEYPIFFLRHENESRVEDAIKIIVDGVSVPYAIISHAILSDGSGETYYRLKIDPTFPLADGKLITIRMTCTQTGHDLILFSVFTLKDLIYEFSEELYFAASEVSLISLEFRDKEQLFSGHFYDFPCSHTKFKLSIDPEKDYRLKILPPLLKVTANGKDLLNHDCWYSELSKGDDITVLAPQEISSIKLSTWDSKGGIQHELKKRGLKYKVECINQVIESEDAFVTLYLTGVGKNRQRIALPLCKLYYKVSKKPRKGEEILYIPFSNNIRSGNIRLGLNIKIKFYCNKEGLYTVKLFDSAKRVIILGPIQEDSSSVVYFQESDLAGGTYKLIVFETTENHFTGKTIEAQVLCQDLPYKLKPSKHGEPFCPKVVPPNSFKVVEPMEYSMVWHEIKVLSSLKRVPEGDGVRYESVKKLVSFHLEGRCSLEHNSIFEAVGYFQDTAGNRHDLKQYNPFNVKIVRPNKESKIIISILDRNKKPLRVGQWSGKINPLKSDLGERLSECRLFEGVIIR